MTQAQLNHRIAARTGESLAMIRRLGFSLVTERRDQPRPEDIRLVLHCPFCRSQVPYPGRAGDGSQPLAECHACDVYFEFDDCEVFPATSRPARASMPARSRSLPV
jgi:hypothetical protein